MEKRDKEYYIGEMKLFRSLMLVMVVAFLFALVIATIHERSLKEDVRDLGQAICEKEYDMDFANFTNGVLYCQPREVVGQYDGIKVNIGGR